MQGKVEICGVNTASLRTLTPAQMDELLLKAKDGDSNARQALIEGNLRLVLSVIQRFEKRGESPDDLFQVGCIGLMKAIANFDPTKGVRFSTYGVPMIAGEVRRYLRDNSAIRVSRSLRDIAYKVLQCKEAMVTELGRDPTNAELARVLELPEKDFKAIVQNGKVTKVGIEFFDSAKEALTYDRIMNDLDFTNIVWEFGNGDMYIKNANGMYSKSKK